MQEKIGHILYNCIYQRCPQKVIYRDSKQISLSEAMVKGRLIANGYNRTSGGTGYVQPWIVMMGTQLCKFMNNQHL